VELYPSAGRMQGIFEGELILVTSMKYNDGRVGAVPPRLALDAAAGARAARWPPNRMPFPFDIILRVGPGRLRPWGGRGSLGDRRRPRAEGRAARPQGPASILLVAPGPGERPRDAREIRRASCASRGGTIAVVLGGLRLDAVAKALIAGGNPPRMPASAIGWGDGTRRRTMTGTLGTIGRRWRDRGVGAPGALIAGAGRRPEQAAAWLARRPLTGRRVVVTRAAAQPGSADPLAARLEAAGAEVIAFPAIELVPPRSWAPVDRSIRVLQAMRPAAGGRRPTAKARDLESRPDLLAYSWIVFLSATGVDRFLDRVRALGSRVRMLRRFRLAAIGPGTARALSARGLRADVVAKRPTSEGLSRALRRRIGAGDRVLLPRADMGLDVLVDAFRRQGALVDKVTVYRTRPAGGSLAAAMRRALARGEVDVLTFASAQTARNFVSAVGPAALGRRLRRVRVVSIGPATSAACRALGLGVHAEARIPSLDGLASAVQHALHPH
jgi:uroporphyrinogen III methyltransferase/synthase